MQQSYLPELQRLLRFGVAGVANTALGYGIIVAALSLGYNDFAANVVGYTAGLLLGFVVNSRWTFEMPSSVLSHVTARYLLAVAVAYCANLMVIMLARQVGLVDSPLSHLVGIAVYSVTFYLGASRYVFARPYPRIGARSDRTGGMASLRAYWPEAVTAAATVAGYFVLRDMSVSHDVVWQMWVARQLLGGAQLYTDILEINPPLWFWLGVPIEWLAQRTGVSSTHAIVAAVVLFAGTAFVLLHCLVKDKSPRERLIVLASAFAAMIVLPLSDFAQREHLALVAAIPYAALIAARSDRRSVPPSVALAIAAFAGPMFALKHYFVLVPALLEFWLILRLRRDWTPFRIELVTLSLCAVLYAVAVGLFATGFFTVMLPRIRDLYNGYEISPWHLIASSSAPAWLLLLLAVGLIGRRNSLPSLAQTSLLAGLAFWIAYFIQLKGWGYHALPVTSLLFFGLAAALVAKKSWRTDALPHVVAAIALAFPLFLSARAGAYANPFAPGFQKVLAHVSPTSNAMFLTTRPSRAWPMVEQAQIRWTSRHYTFWMLPALFNYETEHGALSPRLQAIAEAVRRETVTDMSCAQPELLVVDAFNATRHEGFDALRFFRQDAAFEKLFSSYMPIATHGLYTIYQRNGEWPLPKPSDCRTLY